MSLKTFTLGGLITVAAGGLLLTTLTGCVGVVEPGGPDVVVAGPEVGFFGGWGGHDRDAGRRGFESRGGGHSGGHGHR